MSGKGSSRGWYQCSIVGVVVVSLVTGCASDPPAEITADEYRAQLETICREAAAAQSLLAEPVEASEVASFARDVAAQIDDEAERARALTAPEELDDDHRAFVQNTADQSARWVALAATPADDAVTFGALRTEILQLTLGRDDLAVEMGVDACRRSGP